MVGLQSCMFIYDFQNNVCFILLGQKSSNKVVFMLYYNEDIAFGSSTRKRDMYAKEF